MIPTGLWLLHLMKPLSRIGLARRAFAGCRGRRQRCSTRRPDGCRRSNARSRCVRGTAALVKVVDVLRDQREARFLLLKLRDRDMPSVRHSITDIGSTPAIPAHHKVSVPPPSVSRGELTWIESFPMSDMRVAKRGNAAFLRHAGPREHNKKKAWHSRCAGQRHLSCRRFRKTLGIDRDHRYLALNRDGERFLRDRISRAI